MYLGTKEQNMVDKPNHIYQKSPHPFNRNIYILEKQRETIRQRNSLKLQTIKDLTKLFPLSLNWKEKVYEAARTRRGRKSEKNPSKKLAPHLNNLSGHPAYEGFVCVIEMSSLHMENE